MTRNRIKFLVATCSFATVLALATIFAIAPAVSARGNVGAPINAGTTSHTLSVGGHGEVTVSPDEATVTLGVDSRGTDAQNTLSDNATKMTAVIASLTAQGVPSNHIQTSDLSLYFDSDHNQYVVSHQITARLDQVNRVGSVLDAAVAAGATNSWGVNFGLKDPSAARGQALQLAVADARKRADSMATALGIAVSGVGSASEANYQVQPPVVYGAPVRAGATTSTPVQPGQLTVTADVNVVYTFG